MSTKRMSQLLENVLLAGQADAGKLTFNPAPLDLETFCRDLMTYLQPEENRARPIVFSYQLKQRTLCLDENLLQHILSNLLSNAIKYSPDGSEIEFDVKLEETHQATDVVFRIQDRGIGIPLADQRRLFEPFHRAKNVSSISGTGLGLSIVKQCVDLHQGRISVSSEVGVGTLFKVCLPLLSIEGSRGYGNNSDY